MTEPRDDTWWHEETSRVLTLADGTNEAIVMTNWHWSIYDHAQDRLGWSMRRFMSLIDSWDEWDASPSHKLAWLLHDVAETLIADEEAEAAA